MSGHHFPAPVFDDAIDAKERERQEQERRREEARRRFRAEFPEAAAWADKLREAFPETTVEFAINGDKFVGKLPQQVAKDYEARTGLTLRRVPLYSKDK